MLQQAVDALFDNARCRRPVQGTANRPLKSLTDMIKGKQGRFRENLLGKRVDYSARSVIVVGPELKLHQCGLPKKIALELYQPFVIRKLKEKGIADTLKNAKKELERKTDEVWDVLDEVIERHPVLLNRAPTLHRYGFMGAWPILTKGKTLQVSPVTVTGYNMDFDGDAANYHVPVLDEAVKEVVERMMPSKNLKAVRDFQVHYLPRNEFMLGLYLASSSDKKGGKRVFRSKADAVAAYQRGEIEVGDRVVIHG